LRDDLSADKSSEEDMVMDVVEPADKSSEECEVVDMIEAPANKSLEDEDLQPVVQTEEIVEPVVPTDSTDEDEADNFRQLLADLTARFEKQQQQKRAKKQQRAAANKQGDK